MNDEELLHSTLFEVLEKIGGLKTFTKTITKTALDKTLKQTKTLTVFAPNDNAFAKLPQTTLQEILKDLDRLKDLISYHLVNGEIVLGGLKVPRIVQSMQGENLTITPGDTPAVNNVKVVKPDIQCANGVIHIIYKVLDPYERV